MIDSEFDAAIHRASDAQALALVEHPERSPELLPHRVVMRRAKTLIASFASPRGTLTGSEALRGEAERYLHALRSLQSASGLFSGGDNVQSPPDSSFTINDLGDAYLIASRAGAGLTTVTAQLAEIAQAAADALRTGGVHTPNHRWELCAALARINRSFPDPRLVARIEQWLAEGIDIDGDGFYSERSANYAAHVSNPSLMLLAEELGRGELWDAVERNLAATAALVHPDRTVETVHSRRQDQKERFPLEPFLPQFRIMANRTGRADFARMARLAAANGIDDAELLAQSLVTPLLVEQLPSGGDEPVAGERYWQTVHLATHRSPSADTVLYGGSDVPSRGQIRSGLASNPTFLRLFAGAAVLDSLRLSREFFDLGPFRAQTMTREGEGRYRLDETLEAGFYLPLPADALDPAGRYELEDEGRFSAAMSFSRRGRELQRLETSIAATLLEDGVEFVISTSGAAVPWSLEFAFRPGGAVSGALPIDEQRWRADGSFAYTSGADTITVAVDAAPGTLTSRTDAPALLYSPGQDYGYLDGSDASGGERVYLGGVTGGSTRLSLRASRAEAR